MATSRELQALLRPLLTRRSDLGFVGHDSSHRRQKLHLPKSIETRTRRERQAEKQAVAAERRAIKKSARRHLKQQLVSDLEEAD